MTIFVSRGAVAVNKTEEQIREILKKADKDGDGRLNKEELKQAFRQLGSHFPDWRVFRSLYQADAKDSILLSGFEFDVLVKYALSKYGYKF